MRCPVFFLFLFYFFRCVCVGGGGGGGGLRAERSCYHMTLRQRHLDRNLFMPRPACLFYYTQYHFVGDQKGSMCLGFYYPDKTFFYHTTINLRQDLRNRLTFSPNVTIAKIVFVSIRQNYTQKMYCNYMRNIFFQMYIFFLHFLGLLN